MREGVTTTAAIGWNDTANTSRNSATHSYSGDRVLSFVVHDGQICVDHFMKETTFTRLEDAYDFIADAMLDAIEISEAIKAQDAMMKEWEEKRKTGCHEPPVGPAEGDRGDGEAGGKEAIISP